MDDLTSQNNCIECDKVSNCFKKLIPSELEFINLKKTQVTYLKGENITKQGAFSSNIFYIVSGLVKVYFECAGNKKINFRISKSSDFIGLSGISGEDTYNYSTQAIKDSVVCVIEKEGFQKLISNSGVFAVEIIKAYCNREKTLFNKVRSLGHNQMHGRLANTLLYLSGENFANENIFSYLSRKDLADFACISTESAVRILTDLKKEGIISLNGKKIEILQRDLLKEILRRG